MYVKFADNLLAKGARSANIVGNFQQFLYTSSIVSKFQHPNSLVFGTSLSDTMAHVSVKFQNDLLPRGARSRLF